MGLSSTRRSIRRAVSTPMLSGRFDLLSMPTHLARKVNVIVNRDCTIAAAFKRAQISVFEQAAERGITAKVIHYDTGGPGVGLSLSILGQYARGESAMGGPTLVRLIGIVPDDLLSMLLPDGHQIIKVPEGIDLDGLADSFAEFLATKNAFHHPESEAGRDLGPTEHATLTAKIVHLPLRGKVV